MEINDSQILGVLDYLDETIIVFSDEGEYLKIVSTGEYFQEANREEILGKKLSETLSADTAAFFIGHIKDAVKRGEIICCEYQVSDLMSVGIGEMHSGPDTSFFKAKVVPFESGGQKCAAWIAYDITEFKVLENNFKNSAVEDPVTGVYNGRFFVKELSNFFHRFKRGSNSYSVIMLSLDHSEKLSDTYGREVTEEIMVSFVSVIKSALRTSDLFASTGGEDFIILLPDTPSNGAAHMAERLRNSIENHIFELQGEQFKVTASFGCSEVSDNDSSSDNVLNRSEIALYQVKHNGGNGVQRLNYDKWKK